MNETTRAVEQVIDDLLEHARALTVISRESETEADRPLQAMERIEAKLAAAKLRVAAQAQFGLTGQAVERVRH